MGSLAGHAIPGCFFLVHGLVWAILSIWMQLKTKVPNKKNKQEGVASSSFFEYKRDHRLVRKSWIPLPCCPRLPLEPILKIMLSLVGIITEAFFDIKKVSTSSSDVHLVASVYRVFLPGGQFNDLAKLHHIIMYGAFLSSGIIDIATLCVKLPRQTSQIFFSLAFWVEGMLFYSHSNESNPLNTHTHFILIMVILSCVVFSALRVFQSSYYLINLGLAFCIMLQGTWFIQVGVSLYPPGGSNILIKNSDMTSKGPHAVHSVVMYIYALFTLHVLFLALSFLGLWVVLACFARSGINRRFAKLSNKSSKANSLLDSEEHERLITVDESGRTTDLSVGIELQEVVETVS